MRFRRHIKAEQGLAQINMAPFIDVIFLLLIFFLLTSSFTFQSGIDVKLPKAVTSDTIQEENFVIMITSEDVIYFKNTLLTIEELKHELDGWQDKGHPVLIKADRRASMGRIVDVWDICRKFGIEKINIATNYPSFH